MQKQNSIFKEEEEKISLNSFIGGEVDNLTKFSKHYKTQNEKNSENKWREHFLSWLKSK